MEAPRTRKGDVSIYADPTRARAGMDTRESSCSSELESPAHAGMDRKVLTASFLLKRALRTMDGPVAEGIRRCLRAPRTRGWTVLLKLPQVRARPRHGGPAGQPTRVRRAPRTRDGPAPHPSPDTC